MPILEVVLFLNARHVHEGYSSLFVGGCVSVTTLVPGYNMYAMNLNLLARSLLHAVTMYN